MHRPEAHEKNKVPGLYYEIYKSLVKVYFIAFGVFYLILVRGNSSLLPLGGPDIH